MEEVPLNSTPISMLGVNPLSMDVIPDEEDELTMNNNNNTHHANGTVSNTKNLLNTDVVHKSLYCHTSGALLTCRLRRSTPLKCLRITKIYINCFLH
mgnify:CR=1 FL=1